MFHNKTTLAAEWADRKALKINTNVLSGTQEIRTLIELVKYQSYIGGKG